MLTYKLYFIRHGMTEGNRDGSYVGWTDLDLCEDGITQIEDLLSSYEYPQVQEVYCSPLLRARHTAELIYPDSPMTVVEDLKELSLGDFEGKSFLELQEDEAYKLWLKDSYHNPPPNSQESGEQFAQRISQAVNAIFLNMSEQGITKAAVVTHGGVIMGLMSAFAIPRLPMGRWAVSGGSGFAVSMTSQMWMRDNAYEVFDTVPNGFEVGNDPAVKRSLGIDDEDED